MELKDFRHILGEVVHYSDHIYLHVLGEPLLHPELDSFLKLSGEYNLKVNLTTNGTLIKKRSEELLQAQALRQVNFSLHSFEANDTAISMDKYIKDILDFADAARKNTSIISSFRLWNLHGRDTAAEQDIKNNEFILRLMEEKFELPFSISEKLSVNSSLKLTNQVYLNMARRFEWPDASIESISNHGFCYGLRDQIAILTDGTVVPCCLDGEGTIALGNIFQDSFENIIKGTRARDIFEGFSRREAVEELCKRCGYRTRFD